MRDAHLMSMSNLALSEPAHIDLTGDDDVARIEAAERPAQTYGFSSYPHAVPSYAPKPTPVLHSPAYRPAFAVPSLPRPHQHLSSPQNGHSHIHPFTSRPAPTHPANNVIDLTHSPSPPSSPLPLSTQLPDDLSPRTPVCIGQLTVTALVLYPVAYLQPHDPTKAEGDWASVRLQYEHNPHKQPGTTETIHIKTPHIKSPTGELNQGEAFGVVEQKVAAHLGPMLGKGLIRLDAKVRRGMPNVSTSPFQSALLERVSLNLPQLPILPLQMLVYTPKGNITVVGNYLHQCGLLLDHPSSPYDAQRLANYHYCNPHNLLPGGHRQPLPPVRPGYSGPGGSSSRWTAPAVSGKTLEVQRSQVEELFKSLRSGDELYETEPGNTRSLFLSATASLTDSFHSMKSI